MVGETPTIPLHFTPTSVSSLNMVERFFRSILPPCTEANVAPNHSNQRLSQKYPQID